MTLATVTVESDEIEQLAIRLEGEDPKTILRWGLDRFGDAVAMATGFGPEGVALIDMLAQVEPHPRVFYLDTDFLFRETHDVRAQLARRYGVRFDKVSPSLTPEGQSSEYGPDLWASDPDLCCSLRKVQPLAAYLQSLSAWITSIRRDQTPARATTKTVEWDSKFGLVKINPLAGWTSGEVWAYIYAHDLPYNELHDRSYPSIGCTHCTRPVQPGEDERAGRWSWTGKTECGLHTKIPPEEDSAAA